MIDGADVVPAHQFGQLPKVHAVQVLVTPWLNRRPCRRHP